MRQWIRNWRARRRLDPAVWSDPEFQRWLLYPGDTDAERRQSQAQLVDSVQQAIDEREGGQS